MATTEQLMAQYGVAWFGFDEASGNVYDKLGLNNYVGTVTGLTRETGWNGEGLGIKSQQGATTTAQIAVFNSIIIPTGDFTIRYKVKIANTPIVNNYLLSTHNSWAAGVTGLSNYLYTDGSFGMAYINGGVVIDGVQTKGLIDNKWHDVIITKDTSKLKMYVDNELVSQTKNTVGQYIHSYNLMLMSQVQFGTTANRMISASMDDLQIYNKALSPSDFEQKRLVVKTTDNKNLVLSPNSARVKEIPSTVEYMMLAQGGVVKEIDSAIDSQPIDFTKPTTEYELVTNNKTPLGKGRMFTIPIGNEFKTAMIEDNY